MNQDLYEYLLREISESTPNYKLSKIETKRKEMQIVEYIGAYRVLFELFDEFQQKQIYDAIIRLSLRSGISIRKCEHYLNSLSVYNE